MEKRKNKQETLLAELITTAKNRNIEVRKEKLLREVGYHARSGSCRLNGEILIIIDRDAPTKDQVDFLAEELKTRESPPENNYSDQKAATANS